VVEGVEGPPQAAVVTTRVEFIALDDATIAAYWASGEPADKAGAYGIQGLGGALVRRIEGSYSAVVGLPLVETAALLASAGIAHALTSRG
jgi:septum formation protein